MMRRRDDAFYVRSAATTAVFYLALLVLLALAGYFLRWAALVGLAALLVFIYRRALFGTWRWPPRVDVERLFRDERDGPSGPAAHRPAEARERL